MNKLTFQSIANNKKCIIFYLILTLIATLLIFDTGNYASPIKEILILALTLVIGTISLIYYSNNQNNLHKVCFVIIILFGLMCVFLSPINSISDENEHLWRAEITSNGILLPDYVTEGNSTGFESIGSLDNMPTDKTVFQTDWDSEKINYTKFLANSAFVQNPFYLYIVQAIGIDIAKLLDLNNMWLIWFGRIANLILYASICAVAIKIAPMLKIPLLIIATMPLAVIQGASLSADAFILSFSLVVIAYLLYMYKAKPGSLKKKHILIFFILVALTGFGRVTLAGLSLLILIVPKNNFKNPKYYYLGFIGIAILLAILLAWTKFYAVDSISHSWRKGLFAQKHVNATEQASYMLHNSESIVPFLQIGNQIPVLVDALSRIYTNFDTLPIFNYFYAIFLAIIALFYPIKEKISKINRLWILATFLVILIGTYVVQYLTWAPVGATNLLEAGVVPRYFLPILALLPLICNLKPDLELKNLNIIVITCVVSFLSTIMIFIAGMIY